MNKHIYPPIRFTSFWAGKLSAKGNVAHVPTGRKKHTSQHAVLLAICLVVVGGLLATFTGCTDSDKKNDTQTVKTQYFLLSVPQAWEISNLSEEYGTFTLRSDGTDIGYADVRNYTAYEGKDGTLNFEGFDNHSTILSEEKADDFAYPAYRLVIEHSKPAAAQDDTVTTMEHFLFTGQVRGFIVNLALDTAKLTPEQRLALAQSVVISDGTISHVTDTQEYKLADIWAQAWMTRDGKSRYDIMGAEMRAAFEEQQREMSGSGGDPWVIRWSSPWVTSYTIDLQDNTALITYQYTDSTAAVYEGYEKITFGKEDGQLVVVDRNKDYEETILSNPQ